MEEVILLRDDNRGNINKVAFIEEAFSLYSQRLRETLTKFGVIDNNSVDDVVSAAFLKLYDKFDEVNHDISVWPYLYSIAYGLAQNEKRRQRLYGEVSLAGDVELAEENPTEDVVQDVAFKQGIERLRRKLSNNEWRVFMDNFLDELPHKEIAERDGITEAYSRNKKKRLTKKLRSFDWKNFFNFF
jgi:RNA polymerase sigma factor (sigma-70 family)